MFHIQAIEGSTFRITSQDFFLPNTGDAQQINSFAPTNFCVKPGDRIAFNTVGGYDGVGAQPVNGIYSPASPYPMGTPLRIFARSSSAGTAWYEQANGTDNGESMAPNGSGPREPDQGNASSGQLDGQELLMQMTLATGDDRSYECGGPNTYRPADPVPLPKPPKTESTGKPLPAKDDPIRAAATIPAGTRASVDSKGFASLGLSCPSLRPCKGILTLTAGKTKLGQGRYSIAKGKSQGVRFKLAKAGLKLVKRKKYKLSATATAVTEGAGTQTRKVKLKKRGA